MKNIRDMSFVEMESEINASRANNEKLSEISHLILNLKKCQIENINSKIDELYQNFTGLLSNFKKPIIEQTELGIKNNRIVVKKTSKMSKIQDAILEILQKENLDTYNIHKKLSEKGIGAAEGDMKYQSDYSFTRAALTGLGKAGKIKKLSEKRGANWKILESDSAIAFNTINESTSVFTQEGGEKD